MNTQPFFIKVLTPLHAGSGSDLGVVDLPIQRESHTSFPKIEASSLKGSIRSAFTENNDEAKAEAIFGTGDEAGKLGFSDARILFFPVKSVRGVFAYVTCPMVLNRFEADMKLNDKNFTLPKVEVKEENCIVLGGTKNKTVVINEKFVILEEYSFTVSTLSGEVKTSLPDNIYNDIKEKIVIISDDNFKHFVQNSTEVITRIKMNNKTGTVDKDTGGLFTEEFLPSESVMYALAIGKVEEFTKAEKTTLQIGGDTNLGKGIVEMTIGVKVGDKK
jgi:CRISPR-associated protein Cmr4